MATDPELTQMLELAEKDYNSIPYFQNARDVKIDKRPKLTFKS